MQNLEQIRAAHALAKAADLSRTAVSKLPAMILSNGLLATTAFCHAEGGGDNRIGMRAAMTAVTEYLASQDYLPRQAKSLAELLRSLAAQDSHHLQRATAETLAYLGYLKRFAPKD